MSVCFARPMYYTYTMYGLLGEMADNANTLVQCSLKIRHGRKWKTRWCELTKLSPVSDQIVLKFYKGQDQLLSRKEVRREQIAISAQNFCGMESCIRHPKNPFVLTIICIDQIVLLSFACHNDLLVWFQKTHTAFGNAFVSTKYKCTVEVPNGSRLRAGPGLLYFQDNHFAITDDVPSRLIGGWSLADLRRYGLIQEGFAFEVRSTRKNAGAHVVITQQANSLKSYFDAATHSCTTNRWSHVSSTVSIHEELVPRRRNFVQEMCHLLGTINNEYDSDGCCNNRKGGSNAKTTQSSEVEESSHKSRSQDSQKPHDVEMIELDQSHCAVDSGDTSSGSSVETIFNNCDGLRSPKKTTPIREQNYEIMASFSHLRETADPRNGNESCPGDMHETCLICPGGKKCSGDDLAMQEHEYVNLPPPKSGKDFKQLISAKNGKLDRGQVHEQFSEKSQETCIQKFSSNAVRARTKSLPLSDEDHMLVKHENGSSTVPSKPGKPRSLSVHPSMDRDVSLPRPFDDLPPATCKTLYVMLQDLPGHEKVSTAGEQTKNTPGDVPVPFQHGDLVKPAGPLALLRLNSQSSSSSESVNSVSEPVIDAFKSRSASISRPRLSSSGSSYRKASTKRQDNQPPMSTCEAQSQNTDPDLQSHVAGLQDDLEPEDFIYSRKGSIERRPESPITSAPSVTSYITKRRQSLQRADYSLDETKGSYVEDKAIGNMTRRKRCNTDPSVVFTAKGEATAWCYDPNDNEGNAEGYLIMKPVYEEKLQRIPSRRQSSSVIQNTMPQSPLHSGQKLASIQSKLKRSATVSGEVSDLSPTHTNQRRMSLRERSALSLATPPSDRKTSLNFVERFLRKRGDPEETVKLDVSRPRHKHHYGRVDPENAVRQSQESRVLSIDTSDEVDILSDPEFSECLTRFISEHPPELEGGNGTSSAPASMQCNQIDAQHESGIDTVNVKYPSLYGT